MEWKEGENSFGFLYNISPEGDLLKIFQVGAEWKWSLNFVNMIIWGGGIRLIHKWIPHSVTDSHL